MENRNKLLLGAGIGAAALLFLQNKQLPVKINNVVDSLPKHPSKTYSTRNLSQIDKIIIHHTATSGGSAQAYANHHVNTRDWPGIGYHYVIDPDGTVNQTNYHQTRSYHVSGQNTNSIGVALTGNFKYTEPTAAQMQSLNALIPHIRAQFSQPLQVYQHSDFANKPYDASMDLTPYKINGVGGMAIDVDTAILGGVVAGAAYFGISEAGLPKDANCSFLAPVSTDILAVAAGAVLAYKAKELEQPVLGFIGTSVLTIHAMQFLYHKT